MSRKGNKYGFQMMNTWDIAKIFYMHMQKLHEFTITDISGV